MKLIGLSGSNGSGKDSVANILVQLHGFMFVSVTDLLRIEAKARQQTTEREILRTISAEWRREFGLGVLIDKALELYQQKGGDVNFSGLVISSLRNPGEADRIHDLEGAVVWVDADPKVRYERIFSRNRADDNKSFEQFIAEEAAEMKHSGDNATLSMLGVKEKSDLQIINDGTTIQQLENIVNSKLKTIL